MRKTTAEYKDNMYDYRDELFLLKQLGEKLELKLINSSAAFEGLARLMRTIQDENRIFHENLTKMRNKISEAVLKKHESPEEESYGTYEDRPGKGGRPPRQEPKQDSTERAAQQRRKQQA